MIQITATVRRVIFSDPKSMVHIISLSNGEKAKGMFNQVQEGDQFRFFGKWESHSKYGSQFIIERYERVLPVDTNSIIKYLCNLKVQGLGNKTAEKIVSFLGKDCLTKIKEDRLILMDIPGVSPDIAKNLTDAILAENDFEKVYVALSQLCIQDSLIKKIYRQYKSSSISRVHNYPYELIRDIEGIGFQTADKIALVVGIEWDSKFRFEQAIEYTLNEMAMNGHTHARQEDVYLEVKKLIEPRNGLSNAFNKQFHTVFNDLVMNFGTIIQQQIENEPRYFLKKYYKMECEIAKKIKTHQLYNGKTYKISEDVLRTIELEESDRANQDFKYADFQKEAIRTALISPISIITGGAGTGKSTIVRGICEYLKTIKHHAKIALVAPTGKAAKRLSEITGLEAKTIHRLLDFGPDENGDMCFRCECIDADLLVVDEVSMLAVNLAYPLFERIHPNTIVVLVGDVNQLPAIGAGNVLQDIIESNKVPVTRLLTIFRQQNESGIISVANDVISGTNPTWKPDCSFTEINKSDLIIEYMINQIYELLDAQYKVSDIQVITPMKKGTLGTKNLNRILQNVLNPKHQDKQEIKIGETTFREGDKVIQTVNDYEKDVFNGDVGTILSVTKDGIEVAYETDARRLVYYERNEILQISHAFACTVHKMQGSQSSVVILPVNFEQLRMLNRNLLYTAITRSTQACYIIGQEDAVLHAITKEKPIRYTGLQYFLTK